jgi:diguanylate cyclase (GGDEF)-like protein/PAS domain S-box-containing protein
LRKTNEAQMALAASVALNTQEGVVIADPEMRILAVNKAFTDLTGLSEPETKGKPLEMLPLGEKGKDFWQDILQKVGSDTFWKGEISLRTKEGSTRSEILTISVVMNREGATTHHVLVFTDISKIKEAQEKLTYLSLHDPLTGLPNRRSFGDRVSQGLKAARRHRDKAGVAILDLDGFKEVNDRFGHAAGDRFLSEVSGRLKSVLRESDVLARLGGDEFGLLIGGIGTPREIGDILDRFIRALQFSFHVDEYAITLSGSIGIALYPEDGLDFETLLARADQALYQAKEKGKNRWLSYEPALSESLMRSSRIRDELRKACKTPGALDLHYQPQVDIRTGEILGFEALIRWNHPERGQLMPDDFIEIAETDAPLIRMLGIRVLEESLTQVEIWRAKGWTTPVSVHIGSLHFLNPDFMKDWNSLWSRFPEIPRNRLKVVVKESVERHDPVYFRSFVENLRRDGTDVVVDSFGAGFSSLAQTQEFPVSVITIDRSLARTLLSDSRSLAIVSGVMVMTRILKVDLLLQGVESIEEGILFRALGGSHVQGYLLGHPQPAAALSGWKASFSLPPEWSFWRDFSWPIAEISLLQQALEQMKKLREWVKNPAESLECLHEKDGRCFWKVWIAGEGKERFGTRPEFMEIIKLSGTLHQAIRQIHSGRLDKESGGGASSYPYPSLMACQRDMIRLLRTMVSEHG